MKNTLALIACLFLATIVNAQPALNATGQHKKAAADLVLYPNPASEIIYIEHVRPVTEIRVFNILGQVLGEFKTGGNRNYVLDISELPDGMYFLRICDTENNIYSQKVIKK